MHYEAVVDLISQARFDEYDEDMGTSGLCGVFAMVLHRELLRQGIPSQIVFLCVVDKNGDVEYSTKSKADIRDISWRHVMVRVDDQYFDVNGLVTLEDSIVNFCWGGMRSGGKIVETTFKQTTDILRGLLRSSYDHRYQMIWRAKLRG